MDDDKKLTDTTMGTSLDAQDTARRREVRALLSKHGISEATVNKLKAEHGDDLWVLIDAPVIFVNATRDQMKRLGDKISEGGKGRMNAIEELARGIVVHPEPEGFSALINKYALIPGVIIGVCGEIHRARQPEEAKKV